MTFDQLGLSSPLTKALDGLGYETPSPIQESAIPVILRGVDVLASAQTGTGKTAGFSLPMLQILSEKPVEKPRKIRALIVTPTRELATQVYESIRSYSVNTPLRSAVIFGGVNANPQIRQLKAGVDILVATPGRLLDLQGQGHIRLGTVEFLVLDEADRMLDMGFIRDIRKLLKLLPKKRQNLLFSATFSSEIVALAGQFMRSPERISVAKENASADSIAQRAIHTFKSGKTKLLTHLIHEGEWSQVLVFCRTKHGSNRLTQKLQKSGITAMAIHGNKSQAARTSALKRFKTGDIRVLVATDIAARGLDIPLLPHVVNFELPMVSEDYVHRIGRTGRAGAEGEAMSLVCSEEFKQFKAIQKLIGVDLDLEILPGYEPDAADSSEEAEKPRGGHSSPRSKSRPRPNRNKRRKSGNRNKPNAGGGSKNG